MGMILDGSGNNVTNFQTSEIISIDGGFIEPNRTWQYRFDKQGVFTYLCTIHA
jgi:plastocyanin